MIVIRIHLACIDLSGYFGILDSLNCHTIHTSHTANCHTLHTSMIGASSANPREISKSQEEPRAGAWTAERHKSLSSGWMMDASRVRGQGHRSRRGVIVDRGAKSDFGRPSHLSGTPGTGHKRSPRFVRLADRIMYVPTRRIHHVLIVLCECTAQRAK